MNPELQKSLQVSALSGALDSYMLVILIIMVAAGVLGGLANYFLSARQAARREWAKFATLGVVAALTVPLFLNMISSNLLEAARTRPIDFFVFSGFCLVYVVATRRVFENVANKVLNQTEALKRDVLEFKAPRDAVMAETVPRPEAPRESLTYSDIEILRALAEESFVYGNLVGLTDKTGLAREVISSRLSVLKNIGIIDTRINDKNVLHWAVSVKGKQMLDEVLSGQDER